MSIISPPTDNFYKFLAIGGIVTFISIITLLHKMFYIEDELFNREQDVKQELNSQINKLKEEFQYSLKYKLLSDSITEFFEGSVLQSESYSKDSISKFVLYNLPDSVKNKFIQIRQKREELYNVERNYENKKTTNQIDFYILLIGLYFAEIVCFFGFFKWYHVVQKPIDEEQRSIFIEKKLTGKLWVENCQSCFKTFLLNEELGKEKDGNTNKLYCKECYSEGNFTNPELTYKEALENLKVNLEKLNYGWLQRKKKMLKFKNALRWTREKIW